MTPALRPTVYLPAAAVAALLAAAAPAAAATPAAPGAADTTPDERERARREAERAREAALERARRARRELVEAERALAQAERDAARAGARNTNAGRAEAARAEAARAEAARAEREARDDLGLGDIGRAVDQAVRDGMRGAAAGMRAAAVALRAADFDWTPDDDGPAPAGGPTRIDTVVNVGCSPVVDLSLVSGPVVVTAWGRPDVHVRAASERLPLRFDASGGTVRVSTARARSRGAGEQRLDVEVPVGTRVIARSVSGDVRVRGVRGEIEARTTSGNVEAEGGARAVTLATVSGDVRAAALDGVVSVQSVSGDVDLSDVAGELGAQTTSGDVVLRRVRLTRLRAETVSGDVAYDGPLARGGRYDLASHSGGIRLVLPADAAAALSVRTYSGVIDTAIPLTLTPTARGATSGPTRRLEFTLNGGGAQVNAESFSGSITIARPDR